MKVLSKELPKLLLDVEKAIAVPALAIPIFNNWAVC